MKKVFALFIILAFGAVLLPVSADAQVMTTRRVYRNGRGQTVQVTRTMRARRYRTGTVTPQERRRLARERYRYNRLLRRTRRDGVITRKEARKLNRRTMKYRRDTRRVRNN